MPELLPFVYRKTDGCAVQWLGSSFGVCETCVDVHSPWDFFPIGFLWKCYIYLYMNGWFRLVNGRHINIPDSSHGSFGIWPQETSVLAMGKENSRDTACVSWIFFVPRTVQWLYKANPPKKKQVFMTTNQLGVVETCWNRWFWILSTILIHHHEITSTFVQIFWIHHHRGKLARP